MSDSKVHTTLVEVSPSDFDWIERGETHPKHGLRIPPGGVDEPHVLKTVRGIVKRLHDEHSPHAWMMVSDGEIVGLCSYVRPPVDGEVQIGYGVSPSHQHHGHAHVSAAVKEMVAAAEADPAVQVVTVEVPASDGESQRLLEEHRFERTGTRVHPDDGEVVRWRKGVPS